MINVIDTHAHLEEIEDLDRVVLEAKAEGVFAIVAVGSNMESNQKILEISRKYRSYIYPALGLHPWEMHKIDSGQLENSINFIEDNINEIVAIGEIGLDYDKRVVKLIAKERQKEVLQKILSVAVKYNKPVSVHSRYAWKDCFDIVSAMGIKKAVFHWFTGFSSVLRDILSAGYYISATPAAEYHEEHRRAIKETPLEQLLLETDSPVNYGREIRFSARPVDVLRSLRAVAGIKGMDEDIIARQTTNTAIRLFGLNI